MIQKLALTLGTMGKICLFCGESIRRIDILQNRHILSMLCDCFYIIFAKNDFVYLKVQITGYDRHQGILSQALRYITLTRNNYRVKFVIWRHKTPVILLKTYLFGVKHKCNDLPLFSKIKYKYC